jgi:hypothetical protein
LTIDYMPDGQVAALFDQRQSASDLLPPRCRFLQPSQIRIPTLYASGVQLGQGAESL